MERSTAAFRIMQENIRSGPTTTKDEKMCDNNADDKKGIELSGDSANRKASSANCEQDSLKSENDSLDGEADSAHGEGDGANLKADCAKGETDRHRG